MNRTLICSVLLITLSIQLIVAVKEVQPTWIAGETISAACAAKQKPCVVNNVPLPIYPPDTQCPCNVGTTGGAVPATGTVARPDPNFGEFIDEIIASGDEPGLPPFTNLVGMAFTDNSKELFVINKGGYVWHVDMSVSPFVKKLWLNLENEAYNVADLGLVSVETHPNFNANPYVYLSITVNPNNVTAEPETGYVTIHRIVRYTHLPATKVADINSRLVVVGKTAADAIASCSTTHVGGAMVFGHDGSLFVTTGDGAHYDYDIDGDYGQDAFKYDYLCAQIFGQSNDVGALRAQSWDSINGKLLRIDPLSGAGVCPGGRFSQFNPYCNGDANSARSKIWAFGFRNPYSANILPKKTGADPTDPGIVYVGDVGFGSFEEVNEVKKGQNFGWPCWEGPLPQPIHRASKFDSIANNPGIVRPTNPNDGHAINCAYIYANITVDMPFFYWSRYGAGAAIRTPTGDKDLGYLGQGFLGNCVGGVAPYAGSNYPEKYQDSVWILDYGATWIKVAHRDPANGGRFLQAEHFISATTPILNLEIDPNTENVCYMTQGGQVHMISYSPTNSAPRITVAASVTAGAVPFVVRFSSDGTFDREGDKITYSWNFGDGETSDEANPSHNYTTAGNYTATFTATDSKGASSTKTIEINASGNRPPRVSVIAPLNARRSFYYVTPASWYIYDPKVPVTFDCQVDDEHPETLQYRWEITLVHLNHLHRDSAVQEVKSWSTNVSAIGADSHGGERANIMVSLLVTDDASNRVETVFFMQGNDWQTAWGNALPVVSFLVKDPVNYVKQPVTFDASATKDDNLDFLWYIWNFGDGSLPGIEAKPTHIYENAGVYNVSLTVYDNWSGFTTVSKLVTVSNADGSAPTNTEVVVPTTQPDDEEPFTDSSVDTTNTNVPSTTTGATGATTAATTSPTNSGVTDDNDTSSANVVAVAFGALVCLLLAAL